MKSIYTIADIMDTIFGAKTATSRESKLALPKRKSATPLVNILLLIAVLFSACAQKPVTDNTANPEQPTPTDITETSEPEQNPTAEMEVNIEMVTMDIPIVVSDNEELLSSMGEEGVFHVDFEEEMPSEQTLRNDRPAMPVYTWYFNGAEPESVESLIIEFDLLETIAPLDPVTFGYSRGFFVGIHNFDTIPIMPPWVIDENIENVQIFSEQRGGDTDKDMFLKFPELAVSMQKYVERDGNHIRMVIPYSEFQNASKSLTLQFLPGTTFGHLVAKISCAEGLDLDKITNPVESIETDVFHDQILPIFNTDESNMIQVSEFKMRDNIMGMTYGDPVVNPGLIINPDGSVNMPVSMYDLGAYADEVQGKYAVVPEGLVAVFQTLTMGYFTDAQRRQVIDLALSMIDENGQFAGIYDISQRKTVATDRKVSALPVLSAMLMHVDYGIISNLEIDPIINAIINHQIVRVGNKLYYAPNGFSEDGMMDLKLSDFAINDQLIRFLAEYSVDSRGRLDEKFGCAIFLEGFANSMELILEAQEQSPTRLPSSEVKVIFHEDYSYELLPSDTFNINDSYFSMWLMSYQQFEVVVDNFKGRDQPGLDALIKRINANNDGSYNTNQEEMIREAMAMYAERYDAYRIVNTYYKSCLNIYNFVKTQSSSTVYAAGYNVDTGEMLADDSAQFSSDFEGMTAFRARFGSPSASANWLNLVGMFNDKMRVKEAGHLTMINYDRYVSWILGSQNLDFSNSDTFAENGFNIWGYDSLKYIHPNSVPACTSTRFIYSTSGASFNRENWWEFTLRKLNENRSDEQALTFSDMIPFFYEHLPK